VSLPPVTLTPVTKRQPFPVDGIGRGGGELPMELPGDLRSPRDSVPLQAATKRQAVAL
jgi:hypothetical protein